MKTRLIILAMLFCVPTLWGQTLGQEEILKLRSSFTADPASTAAQNALTVNSDIRSLTLNRSLQGKIDHLFKYRVEVKGITDQKRSGRCWMFTSLNVLRPSVMEKFDLSDFYFSHSYLYFWDLLEKANLFLENIIATADRQMDDREVTVYFSSPVQDGGVWNLYYNVAHKYGVVPQAAMPETAHSENTAQLLQVLSEKLRKEGYALREAAAAGAKTAALRQTKMSALQDVYRILVLCLGEPVESFYWRYKDKSGELVSRKYTPMQFYAEITPDDYNPEYYIMIMNDPTREYYKIYEIENYRNTIEGINWRYLNLPNEDIKVAALASIMGNEAMYASCDVGKQHNRATGIMDPAMYDYQSLLGVDLSMDKKARIVTRQSGSSHAMTLIGCDVDEQGRPVKWEFENSWGSSAGNKGYMTFTDDWFEEYMFRLVIHRKYLNERALNALGQKPEMLPVWDYMF